MLRKFLFSILIVVFSNSVFGQNLHLIERELVKLFIAAEYHPYNSRDAVKKDETVEDSAFKATLLYYTNTVPGTLNYPFDSIKIWNPWLPSGGILNSGDSLVRIYCLRSHDYLQYKSGNGVKCILLQPENGIYKLRRGYRNLYDFVYKEKHYYLAIYLLKKGEGVKIFSINSAGQVDFPLLFKTTSGLQNKIFYTAENYKDNPDGYIYFDKTNLLLYMPVTDENGMLANKSKTYKFTGGYFEETGK